MVGTMNYEIFKSRFNELCEWNDLNLDKMCRKYGYTPQRLSGVFCKGLHILDFLYDLCKDNEIELNWLLGIDE